MPDPEKEKGTAEKGQIGRERPHFFGFQPPKKFVGSLPPCGTVKRAGRFFRGDRASDEPQSPKEKQHVDR